MVKILDIETAKKNRKHVDRKNHIQENQHDFVQSLSDKTGISFEAIVVKLPSILEKLSKKESSFIKDIIFYKIPLISAGHKRNMSLSKSEEFYQTCYDKILHFLTTSEV